MFVPASECNKFGIATVIIIMSCVIGNLRYSVLMDQAKDNGLYELNHLVCPEQNTDMLNQIFLVRVPDHASLSQLGLTKLQFVNR